MAGSGKSPASAYSRTDRLLHRLAFAHPVLQKALGELESDLMAPRFAQVEARRPVFVTGLPRAGSTLLLETLYATGEFATFTYREMPFVLAPILWSDLTKGIPQIRRKARARAWRRRRDFIRQPGGVRRDRLARLYARQDCRRRQPVAGRRRGSLDRVSGGFSQPRPQADRCSIGGRRTQALFVEEQREYQPHRRAEGHVCGRDGPRFACASRRRMSGR